MQTRRQLLNSALGINQSQMTALLYVQAMVQANDGRVPTSDATLGNVADFIREVEQGWDQSTQGINLVTSYLHNRQNTSSEAQTFSGGQNTATREGVPLSEHSQTVINTDTRRDVSNSKRLIWSTCAQRQAGFPWMKIIQTRLIYC